MKKEKCCVCGKPATNRHMSIMGQIPFWVCEEHHQNTYPAIGKDGESNRMGLMEKENKKWVKLKHWK